VYGTPDKIFALQMRDDPRRPADAGEELDHATFTVTPAIVGKGIEKQFSLYKEALAEYEREPALV